MVCGAREGTLQVSEHAIRGQRFKVSTWVSTRVLTTTIGVTVDGKVVVGRRLRHQGIAHKASAPIALHTSEQPSLASVGGGMAAARWCRVRAPSSGQRSRSVRSFSTICNEKRVASGRLERRATVCQWRTEHQSGWGRCRSEPPPSHNNAPPVTRPAVHMAHHACEHVPRRSHAAAQPRWVRVRSPTLANRASRTRCLPCV